MAPSVQEIIELIIDVPAFVFHLSMTILIFIKVYKKHPDFIGGFYHIFLFVAIIDSIAYIHTFMILKATNVLGWLIDAIYCNKCFSNGFIARISWVFSGYLMYYDFFAHSVIAFNRYTAIGIPFKHESIWSKNNLRKIIFLLFFIPLVWIGLFQWMNGTAHYELILNSSKITTYYDEPIVQEFSLIRSATFCVLTAIFTISFNIYTCILYRRLFKYPSIQRARHYNDIKLLTFSIFMFFSQIFMAIYYTLSIIAAVSVPRNTTLANFTLIQYIWISDILSLGNSIVLFVCSKIVRDAYMDFYRLKKIYNYITSNPIHPQSHLITIM